MQDTCLIRQISSTNQISEFSTPSEAEGGRISAAKALKPRARVGGRKQFLQERQIRILFSLSREEESVANLRGGK